MSSRYSLHALGYYQLLPILRSILSDSDISRWETFVVADVLQCLSSEFSSPRVIWVTSNALQWNGVLSFVSTLLLPILGLLTWLRGLCYNLLDRRRLAATERLVVSILCSRYHKRMCMRKGRCLSYKSCLYSGGVESHCILVYCWNYERVEAGWVERGFPLQPSKW